MGSDNVALSTNELQKICHELDNPHLYEKDKIRKQGRWIHFIKKLLLPKDKDLIFLIEKVNQTFAQVEQKGIKIFDPSIQEDAYREKARRYQESQKIYFDIVKKIEKQVCKFQVLSPKLKKAYHELQCREVGLRYSLGKANGGLESLGELDEKAFNQLKQQAESWKKKQKLAVNPHLNALELKQLEEMARYPEWVSIASSNPAYLGEAFDWALRDFNQVEVLIKNYETKRKLKEALLASNLGYVRQLLTKPEDEVLAFKTVPTKTDHVSKRILTLAIYHGSFQKFEPHQQERINILKPSETIHFKQGNYTLTVAEFLKQTAQKNKREINISFFADRGVVNFHSVKGVWNADEQRYEMPKLTENDWFKQVPAARIASHKEILAQYGEKVENREFFFKIRATRKHLDLTALDCHAFLELCVRQEDGQWAIINVGTYANRFPNGVFDNLSLFCSTEPRVVCFNDQNGNYNHRQQSEFPIFPPKEMPCLLIPGIHQLYLTKGVFQFSGLNCAYSAQELAKKVIPDLPNLFDMPLTKAKTGVTVVDKLLSWGDRRWKWVGWLVVNLIQTIFLSHRKLRIKEAQGKEIVYSVRRYLKEKGHKIANPSYLPYQIAQAKRTGKGPFTAGNLYWGNTDQKLFQM